MEAQIKEKIVSIINVFETGIVKGDYGAISIYQDGVVVNGKKTRQITYGRSQTTEQGNLKDLIWLYLQKGGIVKGLAYYLPKIGSLKTPLVDNATFIECLKDASKDPIMIVAQDEFFDKQYYLPAKLFFDENGFKLPLSMSVIYDSFIHSGRIRMDIRSMFSESLPTYGGDEKKWIASYIASRRKWLLRLPDPLPTTVYRMDCFLKQIKINNWDLVQPISALGKLIV
jgi:chitosanase